MPANLASMSATQIVFVAGGIVAAIIATIAGWALARTPAGFSTARRCFWAMALVILGIVVMWHVSTNVSAIVRVVVTGLVGAVVVAGLSEGVRWAGRRESVAAAADAQTAVAQAQTKIAELQARLDDREKRRTIREGLGYLLDYGRQLLERCEDESSPPLSAEAQKWANDAEQFMHDNMDDSFVARFRDGSGLPMTVTAITSPAHRNLWSGIKVRTSRLQEFLGELGYQ